MRRRRYLATVATVASGVGVAGCLGQTEPGSGDATGSGTPLENPASRLDATGFLTGASQSNEWVLVLEVTNPTAQSITAEFSAHAIATGERGEVTSDSVEQTFGAEDTERFQMPFLDPDSIDFETVVGLVFLGFEWSLMIDGEPQPNVCPNTGLSNPTPNGCEYPNGLVETYVEVEYDGDWTGSAGSDATERSISRSESPYGAPEGHDTSYVSIADGAKIVTASAEKQDDSRKALTLRIVHGDDVVAESSTDQPNGSAQVSATL